TRAEHEVCALQELLGLTESRRDVAAQDEIEVCIACDENPRGHPFKPDIVIVCTNCFCANRKNSTSGAVAMTFAAMSRSHCVRRVLWKFAMPSCTVKMLSSLIAISGQIRSFQELSSVKIASVAMAG